MLTASDWKIVKYVAEEVYRQRDDARFVPHMLSAWETAINIAKNADANLEQTYQVLTPEMIKAWGMMISPYENAKGYRSPQNPINVHVGEHQPPHYQEVPRLMVAYCDAVRDGKFLPAEAYKEFELIHPFRDGNGRTGKVIYNFLLGSLLDPVFPPNFFGCANP